MIRLYTEHEIAATRPVPLSAGQAHYLRNVMRLGTGDTVSLFNGRDGEWSAEIREIGRKSGQLAVRDLLRPQAAEPGPALYFSPIKKAPMDFLIQKAVELGVAELQPVVTERTVVNRVNHEKLMSNIVEAAEQCARLTVPDLRATVKYTMLLDNWPADRHLLVCVEDGAAPAVDAVLRSPEDGGYRNFLIGPEGGFTTSERDLIAKLPFVIPVSLGPRILRAETAALVALACWQSAHDGWRR